MLALALANTRPMAKTPLLEVFFLAAYSHFYLLSLISPVGRVKKSACHVICNPETATTKGITTNVLAFGFLSPWKRFIFNYVNTQRGGSAVRSLSGRNSDVFVLLGENTKTKLGDVWTRARAVRLRSRMKHDNPD